MLYSGANFDSRYKPTNSHVSVLSKLPIVTSKSDFDVFLHQVLFWQNKTELFAWMMMFLLLSVIVVYFAVKVRALLSSSLAMEG